MPNSPRRGPTSNGMAWLGLGVLGVMTCFYQGMQPTKAAAPAAERLPANTPAVIAAHFRKNLTACAKTVGNPHITVPKCADLAVQLRQGIMIDEYGDIHLPPEKLPPTLVIVGSLEWLASLQQK